MYLHFPVITDNRSGQMVRIHVSIKSTQLLFLQYLVVNKLNEDLALHKQISGNRCGKLDSDVADDDPCIERYY